MSTSNQVLARHGSAWCEVRSAGALQVDLVQASNLSWFGYPEDPSPSARNLLPGLNKVGAALLAMLYP